MHIHEKQRVREKYPGWVKIVYVRSTIHIGASYPGGTIQTSCRSSLMGHLRPAAMIRPCGRYKNRAASRAIGVEVLYELVLHIDNSSGMERM